MFTLVHFLRWVEKDGILSETVIENIKKTYRKISDLIVTKC